MSIFSREQLEQIANDSYRGRTIATSTYCGRCGYNLRTLPYVYVCPECGNPYNARPLAMKGIFVHENLRIPVREFVLGSILALLAVIVGKDALRPAQPIWLAIASLIGLIAVVTVAKGMAQLRQRGHARLVAKRIAEEEV